MDEKKSILHELYVFSEWKPEPEYIVSVNILLLLLCTNNVYNFISVNFKAANFLKRFLF